MIVSMYPFSSVDVPLPPEDSAVEMPVRKFPGDYALLPSAVRKRWCHERGSASCDRYGSLIAADPAFVGLLQEEWPKWRGSQLPEPLKQHTQTGSNWRHQGKRILLWSRQLGNGRVLLVALRSGTAGQLSNREYEIAQRYAAGATYRQIAESLYRSPATVRNHLAAIYRKLGVTNKQELRVVLDAQPVALG